MTVIWECKIPSAKPIFMDFAFVTVKVLNSYNSCMLLRVMAGLYWRLIHTVFRKVRTSQRVTVESALEKSEAVFFAGIFRKIPVEGSEKCGSNGGRL